MKIKNKKWRIFFRIAVLVLLVIPVLIIVFISPLTKYLIEKYDVKLTGREIKMDWAYVNPFTGYIYFSNVVVYEAQSDSIFFSANSLSADFTVNKLFSKKYEITKLILDEPYGTIIQTGKILNLDDIIQKFSKQPGKPSGKPVEFSILSIIIHNGKIRYEETLTPVDISITRLEIKSSGIRWNSDTIAANYSFLSGIGNGGMEGNFVINTNNLDYHIISTINKLDLNFINQYVKALSNNGNFRATLDANLDALGNFKDAQDLQAKGKVMINEFHFGKDSADDYASFKQLTVGITELSPRNRKYILDTVSLLHPYLKFEQYDYLDNMQRMFGVQGNLVQNQEQFNLVLEIGKYIRLISENFLSSYYQVKRLSISDGDVLYNDFALNEKFSAAANSLSITADSIDKNQKRAIFNFKSSVAPFGEASVYLSINPKDSGDFDMSYHLQKFPLAMFNPFLVTYTSFPLDRGTLELQGQWKVRNGFIQSSNHLIIVDPRVTKRVRKKDSKWIPLPLAMAFIRDRGNVIDYEIPITGNIKKPDFKLKDVIMDILRNIFVKPPTTPYRLEVRNTENKIEKSLNIQWQTRQYVLRPNQEKFVRMMAGFLEKNTDASIVIHPLEYAEKEKEAILFFEAKKKYFLQCHKLNNASFTENDSIEVDEMSNKDSDFVKYITGFCKDSSLYTVQEKCYRFIGTEKVNKEYDALMKKRENTLRNYFVANGTNKRLKFTTPEFSIPYNGFSFYKINYKGETPESLEKAYEKMDRLNEEAPRLRYFRLRKKEAKTSGQPDLKVNSKTK